MSPPLTINNLIHCSVIWSISFIFPFPSLSSISSECFGQKPLLLYYFSGSQWIRTRGQLWEINLHSTTPAHHLPVITYLNIITFITNLRLPRVASHVHYPHPLWLRVSYRKDGIKKRIRFIERHFQQKPAAQPPQHRHTCPIPSCSSSLPISTILVAKKHRARELWLSTWHIHYTEQLPSIPNPPNRSNHPSNNYRTPTNRDNSAAAAPAAANFAKY